jgi:hypothetical protein
MPLARRRTEGLSARVALRDRRIVALCCTRTRRSQTENRADGSERFRSERGTAEPDPAPAGLDHDLDPGRSSSGGKLFQELTCVLGGRRLLLPHDEVEIACRRRCWLVRGVESRPGRPPPTQGRVHRRSATLEVAIGAGRSYGPASSCSTQDEATRFRRRVRDCCGGLHARPVVQHRDQRPSLVGRADEVHSNTRSLVLAARRLGSSRHSGVTDSGTFPADSRRSCLQQGQLPQTRRPCLLWPFQGFAA